MSEQSPEISQENILLGLEAAWEANSIESRLRFPNFKNRVLDTVVNDPNHLLQTAAISVALGRIAVSYDQTTNRIVEIFSKLVLELNDNLDFADVMIGRNTPGSNTIRFPTAPIPSHESPNEPEAH